MSETPPRRPLPVYTALAVTAVLAWLLALAAITILQSRGVISDGATRAFTAILIIVGVAAPFAAVARLIHRGSKREPDVAVAGHCPRCRYDLADLLSESRAQIAGRSARYIQCPECGTMLRATDQAVHDDPRTDGT